MGIFSKSNKRQLIDRELSIYRREKLLEIDKEIEEYRNKKNEELHDLVVQCANDTKDYEHTFHSAKEKLGVELAKLEAQKENLQETTQHYEKIIESKDKEIERLNNIVNNLLSRNLKGNIKGFKDLQA